MFRKLMGIADVSKVNLALVISIAGFVISAANLYLTQLQRPDFRVLVGPGAMARYFFERDRWDTELFLPVGIANTSALSGVIYRSRVVVYREDEPSQKYEIEWTDFVEREADELKAREMAKPFTVPGRGAVSRLVRYVWRSNTPELRFREGRYIIVAHLWTDASERPSISVQNSLAIDASTERDLSRGLEWLEVLRLVYLRLGGYSADNVFRRQ
jgi:hypothetical protein